MFKRFTVAEGVNSQNLVKSSVQRGIRGKIAEQYPTLEEGGVLELLMPKKDKMVVAKWCAQESRRNNYRIRVRKS